MDLVSELMGIIGLGGLQIAFLLVIFPGVPLLRILACEISYRYGVRRGSPDASARPLRTAELFKTCGAVMSTAGLAAHVRGCLTPGSLAGSLMARLENYFGVPANPWAFACLVALGFIAYVMVLLPWARLRVLGQLPGTVCLTAPQQFAAVWNKRSVLVFYYLVSGILLYLGAVMSGPSS
jgi:hypothetical protein